MIDFATVDTIRDLFQWAVWVIGALGAAVAGLIVFIYLTGEKRVMERLREQDVAREKDQDETRGALTEMREGQQSEMRVMREYMHANDKRVTRIEDRIWGQHWGGKGSE